MLFLKIILILVFAIIAFQDSKERAVSWVLFPIVGGLLTFFFYKNSTLQQYGITLSINILMVSIVLLLLFLYTRFIAKQKFLNVSFGLGDLLFFYAFAIGFPTYTFLLLFVSSIIFSLIGSLILKKKENQDTIPLAGLMSFFLIAVTIASMFPYSPSLYRI